MTGPEQYIEGVTLTTILPPVVQQGSLHPNTRGVDFIRSLLATKLVEAFPAPLLETFPAQTPTPSPSTLPATGTDASSVVALLGVGAVLAALGAVLLFASRRRPSQR